MTELFMKLLNMSINAGWLVLTVLLVRIIFRKAPKWLFPVLWSFVGIRLLMPNALESRLSVIPDISGFSASEQGLLSVKGFTAPVPYVGIVWCTGMAAMLLFETPQDVLKAIEGGVDIKEVNLGSLAHSTGKVVVTKAVAMGKEDVETFEKLIDKGVTFNVRKVPSDSPENMDEMLKKAKAELK